MATKEKKSDGSIGLPSAAMVVIAFLSAVVVALSFEVIKLAAASERRSLLRMAGRSSLGIGRRRSQRIGPGILHRRLALRRQLSSIRTAVRQ